MAQLIIQTGLHWQQDNCLEMGAAIAYYALFSLFPLILIVLSVVGFLVGSNQYAFNQILLFAQAALPPEAYNLVEGNLIRMNEDSVTAGIISFGLLLITASGFFSALNRAFDRIWRVDNFASEENDWLQAVFTFIKRRAFAFALVLSAALLLVVSLLSELFINVLIEVLKVFSDRMQFVQLDDVVLLRSLNFASAFLILIIVMALLFKFLPSTRVAWGDVWLGALITSILFMILQQLISNSIVSIGSRFQSYGVAGSVMVLLLWIYLTSQIFFLGGEFTYAYALIYGSRRRTDEELAELAAESEQERT